MKNKILIFVIGLLVGAVIATGVFYIYTIKNNNCANNTQMPAGERPEMPSGQIPQMPNGERPEMPNGEPPEKPSNNN